MRVRKSQTAPTIQPAEPDSSSAVVVPVLDIIHFPQAFITLRLVFVSNKINNTKEWPNSAVELTTTIKPQFTHIVEANHGNNSPPNNNNNNADGFNSTADQLCGWSQM